MTISAENLKSFDIAFPITDAIMPVVIPVSVMYFIRWVFVINIQNSYIIYTTLGALASKSLNYQFLFFPRLSLARLYTLLIFLIPVSYSALVRAKPCIRFLSALSAIARLCPTMREIAGGTTIATQSLLDQIWFCIKFVFAILAISYHAFYYKQYIGKRQYPTYYAIAERRIAAAYSQPLLFGA